jgi:hypothetical protein
VYSYTHRHIHIHIHIYVRVYLDINEYNEYTYIYTYINKVVWEQIESKLNTMGACVGMADNKVQIYISQYVYLCACICL